MNVIMNMLVGYLLLIASYVDTIVEKDLSIFYEDKFLLFKPYDDIVEIYENMIIPYKTYIDEVLIPAPTELITKISVNARDRTIKCCTADGIVWIYKRFKLRYKITPTPNRKLKQP